MIAALVVGASVAFGLLAGAERAARVGVRRMPYRLHPPGQRMRVRLVPDLHPAIDPLVRIDFNADGERGRPLPRRWDDVARVLVVGGSAAECFLNDQEAAWPTVLEEGLRSSGWASSRGARDVYVGVAARSGMCTGSLLGILRRILPQYERLDALVVMVGGSDVLRWLEEGAAPFRGASPLPLPGVFAEHPEGPFGVRPRELALAELCRRARTRLHHVPEVHDPAARWMLRARAMRRTARRVLRAEPDARGMLRQAAANLREIVEVARAATRRILVVRQPWFDKRCPAPDEDALLWHGSVGSAFRGPVDTFYAHEVLLSLVSQLDATVVSVCEESGVPAVDVRPALEKSARHFIDHFHLTSAGCRVVGEVVARALTDADALRARPPVGDGWPRQRKSATRAVSPRIPI